MTGTYFMTGTHVISRLTTPASDADIAALSELICDAVDSGAAVSFVQPLSPQRAAEWWRKTIAGASGRTAILVARDQQGIVGSVQLHESWAPNQPHRADIAKLLVHRRARRRGVGDQLMDAAESLARQQGFTLLTLDAKRGAAAEQLYAKRGWQRVGAVPRFALDPDGKTLHDTVIYYKDLSGGAVQTHPIAVLYRWRLHPGTEETFAAAWSRITELIRSQRGSLGSRLHRGSDGLWYAYAQWPSAQAREHAFSQAHVDAGASTAMRQCIAESLPEVVLDPIADYLVLEGSFAPARTASPPAP